MDNAHYRYTEKEIKPLIEMWNDGVSTKEIAKHFRRTEPAIRSQVSILRLQGYPFASQAGRFQALMDARKVAAVVEQAVTHETEIPSSESEAEWIQRPEEVTEDIGPEPTAEYEEDLDPTTDYAEERPRHRSRIETTTIVTIDGQEVSRTTSIAYCAQV